MNTEMILNYLETYNEHELFYKEYYEKKQDPDQFPAFLASLDAQYIKDNYLVVPELASSNDDTSMQDNWFFNMNTDKSVYLSKHNRYTPPFVHTHAFFEVLYVLRGTCEHDIFGKKYLMQEGDLCLLSPSVTHSIFTKENSLVINILIRRNNIEDIFFHVLRDQNMISEFLLNSIYLKKHAEYLTIHTSGDEDVKNQILEMYMEQFEMDAFYDRILTSMLIIFFTKLARKYKKTAETVSSIPACASTAKLLHVIVNEYDTITLNDLSSRLGYSVPYCSKYIKNVTGHSFQQLLKQVRFQKAENYLRTTRYSVHKISELLGYENPENFMRAFKKEYGISPSQFRTKANDDSPWDKPSVISSFCGNKNIHLTYSQNDEIL